MQASLEFPARVTDNQGENRGFSSLDPTKSRSRNLAETEEGREWKSCPMQGLGAWMAPVDLGSFTSGLVLVPSNA
jgi:hypothetical protein